MIKALGLKIGRSSKLPLDNIKTTAVNLFVGPGDSGKSTLLNELKRYCLKGAYSDDDKILNSIEFSELETKAAEEKITEITLPPGPGEAVSVDYVVIGKEDNLLVN